MSILIKGISIPDRPILIKILPNETAIVYDEEPYETDCFEIKPHGRLIDADKIDYYKIERNGMELYMVWKGQILNMPTIIEGDENET